MADYISVDKQSTSEIVEKKSRFICNMKHVESEDEAMDFIKQMRKKYYDARHNVYAYIIGDGSVKKMFRRRRAFQNRRYTYHADA